MNKLREAIAEHFRANMLDGDDVQEGQMLSSGYVLEYIQGDILKLVAKELLEGKPKKITDHPSDPFWQDGLSSNAKMTGYNQALQAFENHIKSKLGVEDD